MNTHPATIGFNSNSLDRRSDKRNDEAFIEQRLGEPDTRFLVFDGDVPLLRRGVEHAPWFLAEEAARFGEARRRIFLGDDSGGRARFALDISLDPAHEVSPGTEHTRLDLRSIALQGLVDDDGIRSAPTAVHRAA